MSVRGAVSLPGGVCRECRPEATAPQAWRAALARAVEMAETWAARIEQRRQLAALDARMLRDIGRSEADVLRETAKPFWRA